MYVCNVNVLSNKQIRVIQKLQYCWFTFAGYDLIEWLMERLTIEDSRKSFKISLLSKLFWYSQNLHKILRPVWKLQWPYNRL